MRIALLAAMTFSLSSSWSGGTKALAQESDKHYLYDYQMPPGEIAWRKTLMRGASTGYFQPIELIGPPGSEVSVYSEGAFHPSIRGQNTAGMMVGHIYRLKITGIPGHPGKELFPSVEILGRLFPPPGKETMFAIPVHMPLEDLEPAMDGDLVTRVIYLENPRNTIAESRTPDDQPIMNIGPGEDPIRVAEKFGRPMVIVRIGSRVPDQNELDGFGFGTPPMQWFLSSLIHRHIDKPDRFDERVLDPLGILPSESLDGFGDTGGGFQIRQVAWTQIVTGQQEQRPDEFSNTHSIGDTDAEATGAAIASGTLQQDRGQGGLMPGPGENPEAMIIPTLQPLPTTLPPWPDELLMDGGDRGLQVLIREEGERREIHGLDPEDTIGHFDTLDGRHLIDRSNQVVIYSPRFSAIRKVDRLGRTEFAQLPSRLTEETGTDLARTRDFSSTTLQNIQPGRNRGTLKARGVEDRTRGVLVDNTTQVKRASTAFKPWEDFRLLRTGRFDTREKGRLAIAMLRANSWEKTVSAQSADSRLQVFIVNDVSSAGETIHVKTEFDRPQLRLVKIASADYALPGDEIDFTIRFDNVGDQPIGNVTIVDNLTTRLEYIADSAACSVDAQFSASANVGGSQILTWEVAEPLKVNQGGIIRFRCHVR